VTLPATLLPVAVLLPLGVALWLLAIAHWLPPRIADWTAVAVAAAVALLCAWLARAGLTGPVVQWFGDWTPASSGRPGVVLGISFVADPASAAVAAFAALLFAAALVFAWSRFDDTRSHFQVLMLLFLAAIVGFCLTADLFNLFVWFELMSIAAFALTAYPLGKSSLEGAFNFIITNALASFWMLAGVGLLYARTGTLDMATMGRAVAQLHHDPVLLGGFCLVSVALLTKAAILPLHLWLSDAHAVAPTPVSVVFSGVMVSLGLFGLAKLVAQVFLPSAELTALVHGLLCWLGVATALIAGLMTWAQRHLKRLLAFSTIAHMGVMLIGLSAATPAGFAALLLYLFGHGLVKSVLFMVAGILLALCASADELALYRRGRTRVPAGVAMIGAALLLAGLPIGLLHGADQLITASQPSTLVRVATVLATSLTGAAVLRAAARIFLGWSGAPGAEITAPTEREHEKSQASLWLMLAPCFVLLALALLPERMLAPFLGQAAAGLFAPLHPSALQLSPPALPHESALEQFTPLILAAVLVGAALARRRSTAPLARALVGIETGAFRVLQYVHSGLVADYVAWMVVGLAVFGIAVGESR
jgi:multicomponent Na+:H+ antiporter subunit D